MEGFESLGEIAGHREGIEVLLGVLMRLIIELFDCGFFEGAGHTLDLAIGPGMIGLGRPIGHGVFFTDQCKNMCEGILIKPPACRCSNKKERPHFRALRSSVGEIAGHREGIEVLLGVLMR